MPTQFFNGWTCNHETQRDTLLIDKKRMRKDKGLLIFITLFWIIWAPMTLFVTGYALWMELNAPDKGVRLFLIVWLPIAWIGTIGIPLHIASLFGREILTVDDSAFTIRNTGSGLPRRKVVARSEARELFLGRYNDGSERDSFITLSF